MGSSLTWSNVFSFVSNKPLHCKYISRCLNSYLLLERSHSEKVVMSKC